jgi:catalase
MRRCEVRRHPRRFSHLAANIAGRLKMVSKNEIIEHSIAHFRKADAYYNDRVAKAVAAKKSAR